MDGSVNAISSVLNSSSKFNVSKSSVDTVGSGKLPAVFVTVNVNNLALRMELDTGSDNSVVGSKVWKELGSPGLHGGPSLTAYGGYSLPVSGAMSVSVTFKGVQRQLELVVVRTDATALLGRIWMAAFPELQFWLQNATGVKSIVT